MSGIIEGYKYDIFISYRQKDNRGEQWVSQFVEALKTELESTFKEEISVYFDINPHDGLLETHDVDASLKEKLKCLIFIPVISRTYCDPKSFAWEHEFMAFVEQASKDQFGLKVKLPNGNVASRVLPVLIHDLDNADIRLCESALQGAIRGIEFIFKSAGVNRPLRVDEDHPSDNLNKIYYRDQINKVANSIKEIITGLKEGKDDFQLPSKAISDHNERKQKNAGKKYIKEGLRNLKHGGRPFRVLITAALITIMAIVLYYSGLIFSPRSSSGFVSSDGKITVAVLPFRNMTNDTLWNKWGEVIQDNLISQLSNSEELKVKTQRTINLFLTGSDFYNSGTITTATSRSINKKLNVNICIYGTLVKADSILKLGAQIIDLKSSDILKSFEIATQYREPQIIVTADSLSKEINSYLVISMLRKKLNPEFQKYFTTSSVDAVRYYLLARKAFDDPSMSGNMLADLCNLAMAKDSNFFEPARLLVSIYWNQTLDFYFNNIDSIERGKKLCRWLYSKRNLMNPYQATLVNYFYSIYFEPPEEQIKYLKQLIYQDESPVTYHNLGVCYNYTLQQYDKAIPEYEKSLELYSKWGMKPLTDEDYLGLGAAYHKMGRYSDEKKIYKKAGKDFPESYYLLQREAILSFSAGDTAEGNKYILKFHSACQNIFSEAAIASLTGTTYAEAGINLLAETWLRKACSLDPENPTWKYRLAWFLIDSGKDIDEGLRLADQALEKSPGHFLFLDCKGWGLYKKGNLTESLAYIEKGWEVRPRYDNRIYSHLEEVKKAISEKKQNN